MDKKYIFLANFWELCEHCRNFKNNYWDNLIKNLREKGNIQILERELQNTTLLDKTDFNKKVKISDEILGKILGKDYGKLIKYYPTFILINKNTKKYEIYKVKNNQDDREISEWVDNVILEWNKKNKTQFYY